MAANWSIHSRRFAPVIFGFLAIVLAAAAPSETAAQSEWRVYRSPTHGFRILYPPSLTAKTMSLRPAEGTVIVQEWNRGGGNSSVRLTLIAKPAGLGLRDWVKREKEGRIAEVTVAGQPAYVIEGVFEGQLTTEVYLEDRKSGVVINFSHAVRGITDWVGKPVNRIKNRHRAALTDFWNMVESIKFPDPDE
ncbi:MAG TPA: hypothetical protein VM325_00600 [Alphaproteobacteria bacterium]|nr:hypothetical protein [Alphaproteobacteria bacterium]